MKKFFGTLAFAAAVAAPGAAFAGTSTSTGTVTLTVVNQCSVTGANINIGTYLASQDWGDVATATGYGAGPGQNVSGPLTNTLNMGSITCDNGIPYKLTIKGTGQTDLARINISPNVALFQPFVRSVGTQTMADDVVGTGWGRSASNAVSPGVLGAGSGAAQSITGSLIMQLDGSLANNINSKTIADATALATPGTYTDTLTYQLDF